MQIYIYDTAHNLINDIESQRAARYATNLQFSSIYPKGYDACRFRLRRADIFAGFAVREKYTVLVYDGLQLVWDGRIETMRRVVSGGDEYIDVSAAGWFVVLTERLTAKRWIDPAGSRRLISGSNGAQTGTSFQPATTRRDGVLTIHATTDPDNDIVYDSAYHNEYYSQPGPGHYIRRLTYDCRYRSGEGWRIYAHNIATATDDDFYEYISSTTATGSDDILFSGNTPDFYIRFQTNDDTYDWNDWFDLYNVVVYGHYDASHSAYASPGYTVAELVEDLILIANRAGGQLSEDFSSIDYTGGGQALSAYTVEQPSTIDQCIGQVVGYGTSSYETLCFSVWGRQGTSDNLPRCVLEIWDNSDCEYIVSIDSKKTLEFENNKNTSDIWNYIVVQYVDGDGLTQSVWPEDDSSLEDTDSQALYMRREKLLKIGKASQAQAIAAGARYLDYHKAARYQGSVGVVGEIDAKNGGTVAAAWIKAGQRLYVPELDTIFVLRSVQYNAEQDAATLTLDLPPNSVDLMLYEMRRQIEAEKTGYELLG